MYPDQHHPRWKDLDENIHPNAIREPPPMTRTHRPYQQRTLIKQTLPTTSTPYPPIVSTPFLPMPNLTAPYSPPGITIPTEYTRPTPLLKQPPVHSNVLNPTVPNPTSHQPTPNPITQQQMPTPTYAQVANPSYYWNMYPQPTLAYPNTGLWQKYPPAIQPVSQPTHHLNQPRYLAPTST